MVLYLRCGSYLGLVKALSKWQLFIVACGTGVTNWRPEHVWPLVHPFRKIVTNSQAAIFYACATLSGAFGGLIAYGVETDLSSADSRPTWSWLFLIEGTVAVAAGVIIFVFLPRFPDDLHKRHRHHWLFSSEELALAHGRYAGEPRWLVPKTLRLTEV